MLLTEINKTGLTDIDEIVAYFNKHTISAKGSIRTSDIKQYLTLKGLRVVIANSPSLPCQQVMLALSDFETFDCSNPIILGAFTQVLDSLVADTLLPAFTIDDKNYILSLADIKVSLAYSLQIPVNLDTVAEAMNYGG